MITLMMAAAVAVQPAPPADTRGQMTPKQHETMKDCCKDCCKDMAKHEGHASEHSHHSAK